jgi:hypothetical protein
LVGFWALGLTVGAALIIRSELGVAIKPSSGGTPTDFITALLVAGNSLSIVGSGDYAPHTAGTRISAGTSAMVSCLPPCGREVGTASTPRRIETGSLSSATRGSWDFHWRTCVRCFGWRRA